MILEKNQKNRKVRTIDDSIRNQILNYKKVLYSEMCFDFSFVSK